MIFIGRSAMLLAVVQNFKPRIRCYLRASISSKTASHCRSYSSSPQIIFSGIQPTGVPHLGNYLGALKNWVQLQDEAPATTQLFFSIVDLHAITTNQPARQIQDWKRQTLAALLAVGLDPERSTIFYQSSV